MENASKALLIAGAVLIIILIIGVGMAIFGAGQGNVDSAIAQMSAQEKQIYNSQFDQYAGTITPTKLKNLSSAVVANNGSSDSKTEVTLKVVARASNPKVTGGEFVDTMVGTPQLGTANTRFEVTFGYVEGLITTITATEQN